MATKDPQDLLEVLDESVEELAESVAPLTSSTVQSLATKLPVSDKARLYVLTTYALESLIFSYLRLNGVDVKEHPIRTEISRVRTYVQKIKDAQAAANPAQASMGLDKDAAQRFIKAALAGNDKYDEERAAIKEKEREGARTKLLELEQATDAHNRETNTTGDDIGTASKEQRKKRKARTAEEKEARKKARKERREKKEAAEKALESSKK